METYSLFQLNEYIKRVIALNFKDSVWISAEISQVKFSRGHYYLDLIQKEEDSETIKAQSSAIIWFRKATFLEKKFKTLFSSILDTGNEIRAKVTVNFSERYGFSLIIEDLDPSYTLGKAEMLKQEVLNKLKQENLVFLNSELELPAVIQRVAVISSEGAAGYKDFTSHIQSNSYGYCFTLDLFQAAMQGQAVESEVIRAMDEIEERGSYDLIAIIRGGGAKLDLSAFDSYEIGKRIAHCQLPVVTGIGHDIDSSIADVVSHTELKTPTAVADFLIEWNLHFESRVMDLGNRIRNAYKDRIQANVRRLEVINEQVKTAFSKTKLREENRLGEMWIRIQHNIDLKLKKEEEKLKTAEMQVKILAPEHTLKRGYSILRQGNKVVAKVADVDKSKALETVLIDGKIISKIETK